MRYKAPPVVGRAWLSTTEIDPAAFLGRVTVLAFWSLGCEASLAQLQRLNHLQRSYGGSVAVIAVHSPRFGDESDPATVQSAVERAGLDLAVVHDPELLTWSRFDPPGWPTVVVIDHKGRVVGSASGLDLDIVRDAIQATVAKAQAAIAKGGPTPAPLPRPMPQSRPAAPAPDQLSWPSGVAFLSQAQVGDNHGDPDSSYLAVVDSGNDRVLLFELGPDLRLARFDRAIEGLDRPSQVCPLGNGLLAVSEPDRGRVLVADLGTGAIDTLLDRNNFKPLIRPRGLTLDIDGSLVVSDSAAELLIRIVDPTGKSNVATTGSASPEIGVIAGSGLSGQRDGAAASAELSQPVAVARTPAGIAFIDRATSSLRILTDSGKVMTSTATLRDVHSRANGAGLIDGPLPQSRLNRPSAVVALSDNSLLLAEAGSSRLRLVSDRRVRTLNLVGLSRPEGLAASTALDETVAVADTHNHRIVMVRPEVSQAWTLQFVGLLPEGLDDNATPSTDYPIEVGENLVVGYPTLGPGPWTVEVCSTPEDLIDGPMILQRNEPDTKIAVTTKTPGHGRLIITVTGPDPSDSATTAVNLTVRPHQQ